jgi:hypothetical protein
LGLNTQRKNTLQKKPSTVNATVLESRRQYPDKKENRIFLIYKKIQKGAVAKSIYV